MDFDLDESQQVIAESVAAVLAGVGPRSAGGGQDGADWAGAWQALGRAGLLGLVLPGWMGGDDLWFAQDEGTDCVVVHEGYISVTPLQFDLTNHKLLHDNHLPSFNWP